MAADPQTLDALAALRELHMPDPVSWWPPAPGWWLLTAAVVLFVWVIVRKLTARTHSRLHAAARELDAIQTAYRQSGERHAALAAVSAWLRRAAVSLYPDAPVAGLTGNNWLEFLNTTGATSAFSGPVAEMLLRAPYEPDTDADPAELMVVASRWLSAQTITQAGSRSIPAGARR